MRARLRDRAECCRQRDDARQRERERLEAADQGAKRCHWATRLAACDRRHGIALRFAGRAIDDEADIPVSLVHVTGRVADHDELKAEIGRAHV